MAEHAAATTGSAGTAVIDEAVARNASIEIRGDGRDGRPVSARARLLGAEDDRLLVDGPQSQGHPVVFRARQGLDVRFRLNDSWYSFETEVVDAARLVSLNDRKKVVGLAIGRPTRVQVATQRRSHFRVPFIGTDPVELALHDALADGRGVCPVNARRFTSELANLSAGGAGVRLTKEQADGLQVGAHLFMTFAVPEEDEPFTFLVEVRQLWKMPGTDDRRMGVQIQPWPNARAVQRTQQRLERYLARLQRERLQRRR